MSTSSHSPKIIDPQAAEEAITRIREINENMIQAAKEAGQASLDAYENALKSLVDFQTQIADSSQIEWVSTLANMQAKFVQDISNFYVNAARDMLK